MNFFYKDSKFKSKINKKLFFFFAGGGGGGGGGLVKVFFSQRNQIQN